MLSELSQVVFNSVQWFAMMGFLWHEPPLNPNKAPINASYTLEYAKNVPFHRAN